MRKGVIPGTFTTFGKSWIELLDALRNETELPRVQDALPDYFGYLNKDIQIWVNSSDNFGNGYGVIDKELKIVEVFTNVKGYYNVLIIGTRKDKGVSEWKGPEIEKMNK